jgi:glucokinase
VQVMLGVDIGGTKVAVGAVTRDGGIRGELITAPTDTSGPEGFVMSVLAVLRDATEQLKDEILGIGLGCAGTVDWQRGAIIESPNLPIADEPLRGTVAGALGLPTVLDNDANVAALAEARLGAARGCRHVVMLTLGTGVGGGIVLDGKTFRGANGSAGELGHTIVMGGQDPCQCGRRGCLEAYASGTALERYARQIADGAGPGLASQRATATGDASAQAESLTGSPEYTRALRELAARAELDGEAVGRLALQGDPAAKAAVLEVSRWLGMGLANFANIFNPEVIVIGGGLSTLGELLLAPARDIMRKMAIQPNGEVARVQAAIMGNTAGVVGAGILAWEELAPETER